MIESQPYYRLTCDNCRRPADYGQFSAWPTPDLALNEAMEAHWTSAEGKHHCPRCPVLFGCERCGKNIGPLAGELDYLCESCLSEVTC